MARTARGTQTGAARRPKARCRASSPGVQEPSPGPGAAAATLRPACLDEAHRVADGLDLVRVVVRDLDAEGILEGEDDVDEARGVDLEAAQDVRLLRHAREGT
jgi:hypothetical protein